jgi:hypothetical protein
MRRHPNTKKHLEEVVLQIELTSRLNPMRLWLFYWASLRADSLPPAFREILLPIGFPLFPVVDHRA